MTEIVQSVVLFLLLTVVAVMWLNWRQKLHGSSNKRMKKKKKKKSRTPTTLFLLMEVSISKSHSLVLENMLKYS